jgi:hypothetical protein
LKHLDGPGRIPGAQAFEARRHRRTERHGQIAERDLGGIVERPLHGVFRIQHHALGRRLPGKCRTFLAGEDQERPLRIEELSGALDDRQHGLTAGSNPYIDFRAPHSGGSGWSLNRQPAAGVFRPEPGFAALQLHRGRGAGRAPDLPNREHGPRVQLYLGFVDEENRSPARLERSHPFGDEQGLEHSGSGPPLLHGLGVLDPPVQGDDLALHGWGWG